MWSLHEYTPDGVFSLKIMRGEVYQVCWGRISICEEGKEISRLWGRKKRGKKWKQYNLHYNIEAVCWAEYFMNFFTPPPAPSNFLVEMYVPDFYICILRAHIYKIYTMFAFTTNAQVYNTFLHTGGAIESIH